MILKSFEVKEGSYIVRTKYTGDKVYLIQDGKKHWIRNPETLEKLGFQFGQEKEISVQDLHANEEGDSIDLSTPQHIDLEVTQENEKKPVLNYRRSASETTAV